jgi:SH3-like domain-containing protein
MTNIKLPIIAAVVALSSLQIVSGPASAQTVAGEEHCVINIKSSDVLNVRSKGNASSKIVTTLRYGQCGVMVTADCQGSWCPVEANHDTGWVNSRFISMVSPAMYCVDGVAAGDVLNLRAYPSPSSRVVIKLPRHQCDIAFLPYRTGSWQKVRVDGYEGWVNRSFVSGQ